MNRLQDKVAVITGGNSGIGLAAARAFIEEGARVVIFGRDQKTLDEASDELGDNAFAVRGDVTSDADLDRLYAETKTRFGMVDVLFANAGVAEFIPMCEATDEHITKLLDINVKGTFKTVQRADSVLNEGASIVLTTSGSNAAGMVGASVYAATKAAVRSFARTFSAELLGRGIRVNAISPGPVSTPIFDRLGLPSRAAARMEARFADRVPIKRTAQPREIADAVVFLASDESSYVVGSELVVDGGLTQL